MSNRVFQMIAVLMLFGLRHVQAQGDKPELPPSPEKRMAEAAKLTYEGAISAYQNGKLQTTETVYIWSRRWMDGDLEIATTLGERRKAYFAHYGRMKELNEMARWQQKAGVGQGETGVHGTDFYLAEAELMLKKSKINEPDQDATKIEK